METKVTVSEIAGKPIALLPKDDVVAVRIVVVRRRVVVPVDCLRVARDRDDSAPKHGHTKTVVPWLVPNCLCFGKVQ